MKMLYLSPYSYPERVSSSHLDSNLSEAYTYAGFDSVTYAPTPTRGVDDETRKKYAKIRYEEFNDGHDVLYRFPMFREGTNPIQRALRYILVNIIQYFKGIREKDVDVIMGASTPPTQGMLLGLVKKTLSRKYGRKVPFIYNLQDIFPDSMVNAKMTTEGSIIWKIGRKVEAFTYRNADKIIVISDDFKRNIMAKGVPEEKIVVIPNWVDTSAVYSVDRDNNPMFAKYDLDPSKFYICYSGNIGHSQNIGMLLEAAKKLANELPELHFVIIGDGAAKNELAQAVVDDEIENITLLPFQDYADIAYVFSLGDTGLIISKPGIGGSSVPSKTWSIMAAERPVLASFDEDSQLAQLIRESECGLVAQAGDADAFVAAAKQLYAHRQAAAEMGKRGRAYVQEKLSKETCTGMYVSTILNAIAGR